MSIVKTTDQGRVTGGKRKVGIMENQKMQNEQWYREIATELRQYKKYKARIGVLEARMIRQTGPINKVSAQYGDITSGAGCVEDTDEEELEQLKVKVESIEFALSALTVPERKIVELKFFERHRDVIIYEMDMPMSSTTFYKLLNGSMKTVQEILSKEKIKTF